MYVVRLEVQLIIWASGKAGLSCQSVYFDSAVAANAVGWR